MDRLRVLVAGLLIALGGFAVASIPAAEACDYLYHGCKTDCEPNWSEGTSGPASQEFATCEREDGTQIVVSVNGAVGMLGIIDSQGDSQGIDPAPGAGLNDDFGGGFALAVAGLALVAGVLAVAKRSRASAVVGVALAMLAAGCSHEGDEGGAAAMEPGENGQVYLRLAWDDETADEDRSNLTFTWTVASDDDDELEFTNATSQGVALAASNDDGVEYYFPFESGTAPDGTATVTVQLLEPGTGDVVFEGELHPKVTTGATPTTSMTSTTGTSSTPTAVPAGTVSTTGTTTV